MTIETKYEVGDFVYPVSYRQYYKTVPINCLICDDTGKIQLRGHEYICPECKGKENPDVLGEPVWYIDLKSIGSVTNVEIKISNTVKVSYKLDTWSNEHSRYMKLWEESALFLSREIAEQECIRRNRVQ